MERQKKTKAFFFDCITIRRFWTVAPISFFYLNENKMKTASFCFLFPIDESFKISERGQS